MPLPPNTARVFSFILQYKTGHDGNSPGVREIREALGLSSTSLIASHLRKLETRGLITLRENTARGIEVIGGKWTYDKAGAENGNPDSS